MLQLFTFSAAVLLFEPVGGVRKSFGSEGFEKQCNRPEFKWVRGARRTDGCAHSQICRSIVQNPLCSRFNRALSFPPRRLLWPLYHRASVHTLYSIHSQTRSKKRSLFSLFFIQPLSRSGSLSPSNAPLSIFLSPFLFLSTEERDKEIVFLSPPIRSAQLHKPANTLLSSMSFFHSPSSLSEFSNSEKWDAGV